MADTFLHVGATIQCTHGGQVSGTAGSTRVKVGGQAVVVLTDNFTVAGCPFQVPVPGGTKPQPCVKVQWVVGATRVRVNNQAVLLQTSSGICQSAEQIPQGSPSVVTTQVRVKGT